MATRATTLIAVAVVKHADCFLVGKRPPGVPLAGFWEFPGGKVHAGETPAMAAARECTEETGLAVDVGNEFMCVAHAYEHGRLELHFFECTLRGTATEPRAPFRWATKVELRQYEFPPANRALLAQLLGDAPS